MEQNLVVGIGEVLWDMLPDGRKLGGAPANFAYHITQLGLPGMVASAVGSDSQGREIKDILSLNGIDSIIPEVGFPTGTVEIKLDASGIPEYDITTNVAWDNIPFTPQLQDIASRTRAVCFGSLAQRGEVSRSTISAFIDAMPRSVDTLKVFDINLRQDFYGKNIISDSLEHCNILKINDEELATVSSMFGLPEKDFREACRKIVSEYNLKALILTCGVNGSYVFTPDGNISFRPTPEVEVADTVGAGDSFTAAFIAGIIKGKPVTVAHSDAARLSAYVCTQNGAMPMHPSDFLTD